MKGMRIFKTHEENFYVGKNTQKFFKFFRNDKFSMCVQVVIFYATFPDLKPSQISFC